MMVKCKWCGIFYVQTVDKLEYCSEKCKESAEDNFRLTVKLGAENFEFFNMGNGRE